MAKASDKKAMLIQNLEDVGCDKKTIEHCVFLAEQGEDEELLQIMSQKKQELLDSVHKEQKQIDCLDYFVYQLKRGKIRGDK